MSKNNKIKDWRVYEDRIVKLKPPEDYSNSLGYISKKDRRRDETYTSVAERFIPPTSKWDEINTELKSLKDGVAVPFNSKPPLGFVPIEENSAICKVDPKYIPILDKAFDYLEEGYSRPNVSEWVNGHSDLKSSPSSIFSSWKRHRGHSSHTLRDIQTKLNSPRALLQRKGQSLTKKKVDCIRKIDLYNRQIQELNIEKSRVRERNRALKKGTSTDTKSTVNTQVPGGDENGGYVANGSQVSYTEDSNIVFKPNPGPQTQFLGASEREVLYGGAAGGGKSIGLLADPMRYFNNSNFNGLILRRTNDELRELIFKSQELYPSAFPGARWQEKKSQWVFTSGARLWMTYLERDEDVLRYQGQSFSYIGWDELTQHPSPFAYNYMRSRLRTSDSSLPIFVRATSNPGGPGHSWVKRMFIDPAAPDTVFNATDIDTGEELKYPKGHRKEGEPLFTRRFIPAFLKDNPFLFDDGIYEGNLLSLSDIHRRQLLEGDWQVAEGAAFSEFRNSIHVCKPYNIPGSWRRFRSCDFGYSSFSAVHWFAVDQEYGTLIVYRELYVRGLTAIELAKRICSIEKDNKEYMDYGVLDSSCWHKRGHIGPSIAEEMNQQGCRWRVSDRTPGSRTAGKNRLHQLLRVDSVTKVPGIKFFDTCRQAISDIPSIPSDPGGTEDIDKRYTSDHTYDSIRYGIMTRPARRSPFEMSLENRSVEKRWKPASMTLGL